MTENRSARQTTLRLDAAACRHAHAALLIAADRRQAGWRATFIARTASGFLARFADSLDAEADRAEAEA
jgi:hypothetical protein